MGGHPHRGPNQ
jgi:hypothetical protein